ncbi:alkaline phosphatase family protein [Nonomuraea sp. NPDC046802]|uniref:alkaline phosphatase family protein n=1 Tax=Nonomuraea sp. NPDC046802 TaxID=3154919 RepID=UPI0033F16A52
MNVEGQARERSGKRPRVVVFVVDGLRADDVTGPVMPALSGLALDGVRCTAASTVLPSVTRAAAASLVTGCLPRRTGVIGNRIWTPDGVVNTGAVREVLAMRSVRGRAVEAPTLGEILAAVGLRVMVVGTGSAGCAYLLHPEVDSAGGAVVMAAADPDVGPVLPVSLHPLLERHHGAPPSSEAGSASMLSWAVDVASGPLLDQIDPDVLVFWCGEPDEIRHAAGLGAASTMLGHIDAELDRLLASLRLRNRSVDVIVTADHGMVALPPGALLGLELFDPLPAPLAELVTICNSGAAFALHLPADAHASLRHDLVRWCREQAWADGVYADADYGVPGVRPMAEAGCDHPLLGPTVLATADPCALPVNPHGTVAATHGTLLPDDVGIPLIAHGPHLVRALTVSRPVVLTDVLPTVLEILGVPLVHEVDGTPIFEALAGLPSLAERPHR